MEQELLKFSVTQLDEKTTNVINDGNKAGSKSYMWVHRSGELYKDKPIVLYEYQKGRNHELPLAVVRAESSAIIYSISETAKLNNLTYCYFKHLLIEPPQMVDENGNIDDTHLDELLSWSKELPDECRKNTPH